MNYNPNIHNRKSIRLKRYDYSQKGLYFITICCQNRTHFYGKIIDGKMILNDAGKMIEKEWLLLKQRFTAIELEAFIVMPNHFHAILNIVGETLVVAPNQTIDPIDNNKIKGQPQGIAPTNKTVGEIIGAYKSITTNQYIWGVKNKNWKRFDKKLWQRNYWEHIIQNERSYQNISRYIKSNPKNWQNDTLI